jgi:hypothetical protein
VHGQRETLLPHVRPKLIDSGHPASHRKPAGVGLVNLVHGRRLAGTLPFGGQLPTPQFLRLVPLHWQETHESGRAEGDTGRRIELVTRVMWSLEYRVHGSFPAVGALALH